MECSQKFVCEGRIVELSAQAKILKTLGSNIGYPKLSIIYCDHMDECHKKSKDCEIIPKFKENTINKLAKG